MVSDSHSLFHNLFVDIKGNSLEQVLIDLIDECPVMKGCYVRL